MGFMSPSSPKLPAAPPPVPQISDKEVSNASLAERRRRAGSGQASTVLTSGLGDVGSANTASKVLLGGGG